MKDNQKKTQSRKRQKKFNMEDDKKIKMEDEQKKSKWKMTKQKQNGR